MLNKANKVVIVIEKLICQKVCDIILSYGVQAYTLVPAGGKGHHHIHAISSKASVVDDFTNIKIEVIVKDKQLAEQITQRVVDEFFKDYSGITYIEQVEILRSNKFDV
jgi:nitrogen regulatory protein PII